MTIPHVQTKIMFDHVSCQFSCLLSKMYQQFKLPLFFAAACQSSNLSPTSKEKPKIQENNCAVVPRHSSVFIQQQSYHQSPHGQDLPFSLGLTPLPHPTTGSLRSRPVTRPHRCQRDDGVAVVLSGDLSFFCT